MKENLFVTKKHLIKDLKNAEDDLAKIIKSIKTKESDLWLNTEFKELGYTNKDTRRAYVDNQLSDLRYDEYLKKNEIQQLKREFDLVNDKLKLFI